MLTWTSQIMGNRVLVLPLGPATNGMVPNDGIILFGSSFGDVNMNRQLKHWPQVAERSRSIVVDVESVVQDVLVALEVKKPTERFPAF